MAITLLRIPAIVLIAGAAMHAILKMTGLVIVVEKPRNIVATVVKITGAKRAPMNAVMMDKWNVPAIMRKLVGIMIAIIALNGVAIHIANMAVQMDHAIIAQMSVAPAKPDVSIMALSKRVGILIVTIALNGDLITVAVN